VIRKQYKIADFFAGCGGLSYGFSRTRRFSTVLGSDIKPEALETFAENHKSEIGRPATILEDIRTVRADDVECILSDSGVMPGELDCLIGGPPCEGFSQNRSINSGGHSRDSSASRVNQFIDDPRNDLFKWFIELAAHLKPAVVLIENVPDLVRHKSGETLKEVISSLDRAGYRATVRVLNAADYGVPQMRRRTIFLAQRKEDFVRSGLTLDFPLPTHAPFPLQFGGLDLDPNWLPGDSGYWPTVWEAIGDLPQPTLNSSDFLNASDYPMEQGSALRRYLRSEGDPIYNHVARKLGKNGLEKVTSLTSGQAASDLPAHLKPKAAYHYSYSRLRWAEPARTITKFCYHVGSGMFAHPTEDRAITMREAARLQTFPDSFRFLSDNIRDLSSMIGSAVPPLLAQALGGAVSRYLDALQAHDLPKADRKLIRPQSTDAVMKRLHASEWGTGISVDQPALI
jgi:DNA (cytosine-5)-methyltransferase 1